MLPVPVSRHPVFVGLLLGVILCALLGSAAAASHAHGDVPGLYSEQCQLSALATLASSMALGGSGPDVAPVPVAAAAFASVVPAAPFIPAGAATPRAPPRA